MIFMAEIFDGYMKNRLADVALGRRRRKNTNMRMGTLTLELVTPLGNGKYKVKSQSTPSLQYTVDLETGFCECNVGENGSLCKHQAACAEHSMTILPQVFTATSKNRRWLASVAVGEDKTPPESFFRGLLEPQLSNKENQSTLAAASSTKGQDQLPLPEALPHVSMQWEENKHCPLDQPRLEDDKQSVDISEFVKALHTITEKYGNEDTADALKTAVKRLHKIKSTNMLNSVLHNLGSDVCTTTTGAGRGKIRCQPSSVARRGPGRPKGAAPLGKGRRPNTVAKGKAKRPRNLAENIAANVPNAKSHGSGH